MKRFAYLAMLCTLLQSSSLLGSPGIQYVGVDLYTVTAPEGATNFFVGSTYGGKPVTGGQVIGDIDFGAQAVMWNLPSGASVNFHPTNPPAYTYSSLQGTDGFNQVGYGYLTSTGLQHALLWQGVADSPVDLHPTTLPEIRDSVAIGVSGNQQVGSGTGESSSTHALVWSGTAASASDLHPTHLDGILDSVARATDGIQQAGSINRIVPGGAQTHAVVWNGTAESAVDLHPGDGFDFSTTIGVYGGQQVGWANNSTGSHPMMWTGTAESAVDLNPTHLIGISGGAARGTDGIYQVGSGFHLATGTERALLWAGTADSAVDLHALLPGDFRSSTAYSIDADGTIWGLATANDAQFQTHAVKWTPIFVPEPTTVVPFFLAAIATWSSRYSRTHGDAHAI